MATQVQFRRGTSSQNDSFTGAVGEISINTSIDTIRVHDGSTQGGFELAKNNLQNINNVGVLTATVFEGNINSSGVSTFANGNVLVGGATTALVVRGDARITGILTVGTGSVTINGTNDSITIGSGLTITSNGNGDFSGDVTVGGGLTVTGAIDVNGGSNISGGETILSSATISDLTSGRVVLAGTSGAIQDSANLTFNGSTLNVTGDITLSGDLTVNGTTTTINSTTLTVDDKNIELGATASPSDTSADGGGITLKGSTDHTISWSNANDSWDFSEHVNIASGKEFKINNVSVLSATTLGSSVVNSSLTSVGTIASGTWQGTAIANNYLANSTISGVSLGSNLNTLTMNTSGTGLSGSTTYNGSGASTFTVTSNATSNNTNSTIVARDGSGNFSAGTITATLAGTATTTTNIPNLSGDITSANTVTTLATVNSNVGTFGNGSNIPTITVNAKGLVTAVSTTAVDPANDGTLTLATSGTGLSGSATFTANDTDDVTFTVTSNATNENTGSTIVARDASGNFNAGIVTATSFSGPLTGNVTGNVTGTVSGNAGTATKLATARTIALSGDVSGSTTFDGSANVTITATVADDSHNHTIANVDGLQSALDAKAPLASPALTGTPTAPTAAAGTSTTQVATTAFVSTAVSNLVDSAPTTLDTLNELAAALGDDPNFATTVTNSIATKLPLSGGQMTGNITFSGAQTVDGRDLSADGAKLDGIESGATADQTASEILTAIKTVDGASSGLDADLLDGQEGSYYRNASNINAGTIGDAYLPATISSDITGNAATATALATARTIALSGDVTGSASFDGSANATITATVADDSHNHVIGNIDNFTEEVQDIVGGMVSSNTESGIAVTYDDTNGKLNFDVSDPTITLSGAVTGSATMTNLGNVTISTTATSDPTLTLAGDASGSATFTNLGNATLTVTVADDSHNHVISNIDGLQTALDGKLSTTGKAADSNLLDGIDSSAFLRSNTADSATAKITFDAGIRLNDSDILEFGSSADMEMFHNGTHGYLDLNTGDFIIRDGTTTRFTFDDAGHLTVTGNINSSSDARLKTNITTLTNSLDKVLSLRGVEYDRVDNEGMHQIGVIAQEVEEVVPDLVSTDDNGMKSVAYGHIAPLLIEAIKEQQKQIEALKAEIKSLKS